MIDNAAIAMQNGQKIAAERVCSVNDNTLQSHYHPFFEMFYLEAGSRNVIVGNSCYQLEPKTFIIYPPYTMHRSYSKQDIEFSRIVLYFTPEMLPEGLIKMLSQDLTPHNLVDPVAKDYIYHQINQILIEQDHPQRFSELAIQSQLQLLLINAIRQEHLASEPLHTSKIASIINYIHQHYFEHSLSLSTLEQAFFISSGHLCREFKRFTQCSFVEYLNKIRVLHAQRLFVESNKTITQIAIEVGFGSLTNFERAFVKNTQQQPRAVCKRMRAIRDQCAPKPHSLDTHPGLSPVLNYTATSSPSSLSETKLVTTNAKIIPPQPAEGAR